MDIFNIVLVVAVLLCSLVAGLLFAFVVVVMPGIKRLDDKNFIKAFQVMDGIIQNNQPLFMIAWVGSVLFLLAAVALGIAELQSADLSLLALSAAVYVFGVQLPTVINNIPLNNKLQTLNTDALSEKALHAARQEFESKWNRWNIFRTFFSIIAVVFLLIHLYRL